MGNWGRKQVGWLVFLKSFCVPFLSVRPPESTALEAILRHHRRILEALRQRTEQKSFTLEEEQLAEAVTEVGQVRDVFWVDLQSCPQACVGS